MEEVDTSKDEHLSEEDAIKQAKKDGIEFVDWFTVEGDDTRYETEEEAREAAGDKNVLQHRERKQ